MTIYKYQYYHGAVLPAVVRSDRPVTLRMIETNPRQAWAAYTINDTVVLYVKYRTKPDKDDGGDKYVWTFTFDDNSLKELNILAEESELYLALVCSNSDRNGQNDVIALIDPSELADCINLNATQSQWIRVRAKKGYKLRVWGSADNSDYKCPLKISRSRLMNWNVPGS